MYKSLFCLHCENRLRRHKDYYDMFKHKNPLIEGISVESQDYKNKSEVIPEHV